MPSLPPIPQSGPSRSLLEVALGFIGTIIIVPLLFKFVFSLFKLSIVRRLIGEIFLVGLTATLTNEGVLNRLFGSPGKKGDGLLKPNVSKR